MKNAYNVQKIVVRTVAHCHIRKCLRKVDVIINILQQMSPSTTTTNIMRQAINALNSLKFVLKGDSFTLM